MELNEAQAIIDLIGGAVNAKNFNAHTYELWLTQLAPLDAKLATNAALSGIQDWDYFPSWAQFYTLYQGQRRLKALDEASVENAEALRRGERAPEWAYIWLWARYGRTPREERSFPQQERWGDPENTMSMNEYKKLRAEWVKAGEPRLQLSEALA